MKEKNVFENGILRIENDSEKAERMEIEKNISKEPTSEERLAALEEAMLAIMGGMTGV